MWQYNSYTYAYYYFNHNTFLEGGTKGADGKTTYSDEEKAAAAKVAKEMADKIAAGEYEDLDAFDKAINALMTEYMASKEQNKEDNKTEGDKKSTTTTEDEKTDDKTEGDKTEDDKKEEDKEEKLKYVSTRKEDDLYSKLNTLFADWLRGKDATEEDAEADKDEDKDEEEVLVVRNEGDMTVIVSKSGSGDKETINGYYVLRFGSVEDNTFKLKNVRHLLVAFEGGKTDSSGNKTYTKEEKEKAKAEAERLLDVWKSGKATEDTFKAKEYAQLLYCQALIMAELPLDDPMAYTELVCKLMK
jgi:hypothetical protein